MRALLIQLSLSLICIAASCLGQDVPTSRISHARAYVFSARCKLHGLGAIDFIANEEHKSVLVNGTITGLSPENHAFHIHEFGDYGNNCLATGDHFNPHGATHGGRESPQRHVGDLGNIAADADGTAHFSFEDLLIALNGPESIIGRAVVIHANPDPGTTANSGPRVACGVIGIVA